MITFTQLNFSLNRLCGATSKPLRYFYANFNLTSTPLLQYLQGCPQLQNQRLNVASPDQAELYPKGIHLTMPSTRVITPSVTLISCGTM
jgi:hypothetical protein